MVMVLRDEFLTFALSGFCGLWLAKTRRDTGFFLAAPWQCKHIHSLRFHDKTTKASGSPNYSRLGVFPHDGGIPPFPLCVAGSDRRPVADTDKQDVLRSHREREYRAHRFMLGVCHCRYELLWTLYPFQ